MVISIPLCLCARLYFTSRRFRKASPRAFPPRDPSPALAKVM
ncbi:MAG: hypothetical protein WC173_07025 [Bacteroidales bacterium]